VKKLKDIKSSSGLGLTYVCECGTIWQLCWSRIKVSWDFKGKNLDRIDKSGLHPLTDYTDEEQKSQTAG
jgi:hypothetical protein